jgi:hypothetical protein
MTELEREGIIHLTNLVHRRQHTRLQIHKDEYLILFFLNYYCIGAMLRHLPKLLQYIIVEFTPSIILLYLSSSLLRIVSPVLIFHFHTRVHNIFTINCLPTPFLYILSPLSGTNRACFTFLVSKNDSVICIR